MSGADRFDAPPRRSRWKLHWISGAAAAAILLSGLIRLPVTTETFWNIDEAVSACVANTIVDGGLPYRDSVDHRGPGTYYVYALIFWLFGKNNMDAVHICLAFVVMAIEALLYWICSRYISRRTGLFAVLCFALLSFVPFWTYDMLAANTEWFQTTFTLSGVVFLLVGLSTGRLPLLLVSGAFYGIGYMTKQPALFDFAGAIGYLLLATLLGKSSLRLWSQRVACLLAGFFFVNAAVLTYFAARAALPDFVFYFWTYNTKYYLPAVSYPERVDAYRAVASLLIRDYFPFILLFGAGVVQQAYSFLRTRRERGDHYGFLLVCWALSSWIGTLLSGRNFGHYFIQVLPGVSLVTALALDQSLGWTQTFLRRRRGAHPGGAFPRMIELSVRLALVILVGALLRPVGDGVRRFVALFDPVKPILALSLAPGRTEKELVSAIQRFAPPKTPIFIWGWYTELYVLADRRPASRYTAANWVTGMIPWQNVHPGIDTQYAIVPGTREILMRELTKSRPAVIVDTSPGHFRFQGKYPLSTFPELDQFVREQYALAVEVRDNNGNIAFRLFQLRGLQTLSPELVARLDYGRKISFKKGGDSEPFRVAGWSHPEEDYTWTEGVRASLTCRVAAARESMALKMTLAAFYRAPAVTSQAVDVSINGEKVGTWDVVDERVHTVRIPEKFLADGAVLVLDFSIPKAIAPISVGHNVDTRFLGVRCSEMEISADPSADASPAAGQSPDTRTPLNLTK